MIDLSDYVVVEASGLGEIFHDLADSLVVFVKFLSFFALRLRLFLLILLDHLSNISFKVNVEIIFVADSLLQVALV